MLSDLLVVQHLFHEVVFLVLLDLYSNVLQMSEVLLMLSSIEADFVQLLNVCNVKDCKPFLEFVWELFHVLTVVHW